MADLAAAPPAPPASPAGEATSSEGPRPQPVRVIRNQKGWRQIDLRGLVHFRDLIWFLTKRDLQLRYRQTALGVAWAVLQPVMTMLVFSLFFGKLAKIPSDGVPYPIFAYAALVPWTFFAHGLSHAANELIQSANLLKKVYFPRLAMPIAVVLAAVTGIRDVLMGLERSASEPTLIADGVEVNHQFSKSAEAEALLRAVFEPTGVRYLSVLRPMTELAIGGAVADRGLTDSILSCNRAFTVWSGNESSRTQRPCGECAKCLFTALMLVVSRNSNGICALICVGETKNRLARTPFR